MDDKLKRALDRRMAGAALPEASRARILQAAAHGKGRNMMKAKRKAILVMAAALLLISGCVGAALYHDLARQTMDDWEQGHSSTPLGLSQSFDGYTITLDEIYGGSRAAYLKGTVSRDDGKPLRAEQVDGLDMEAARTRMNLVTDDRAMIEANDTDCGGGASGPHVLADTDRNDSKVEFIYHMYFEEWPEEYTIAFERISYVDTDLNRMQLFYGDWTFTFPVEWEPVDEILPLGQEVTLEDGKGVYLEALYFEPLDVCLDYRILSEDDRIHPEICLLLKNGERLAAWLNGGSDDGITCYFESFNRGMGHIGIDDVQSLIIGGVTVPIAE